METRGIDGYVSYFQDDPVVDLGQGYLVVAWGYTSWAKERQKTSAINLGDIQHFKHTARNVFYLGMDVSFDESGLPMRCHYCPVHQ
eukprot:4420020-Ditylum_brightwellii.AAC.1